MSPTYRIGPGSLLIFRQGLARVKRVLDDIVVARGRYEPGHNEARLIFALALSLLIHAFVLSLRFGIAGFGLPGLASPWAERRAFSSDLSVRIAAVPRASIPEGGPARIDTPRRAAALKPLVARPPVPGTFVARTPTKPKRAKRRPARAKVAAAVRAAPKPAVAAPQPPAKKPSPQQEIIAQAQPLQETFLVPPPVPDAPERAPEVAAKQIAPPVNKPAASAPTQVEADAEADRRAREEEVARLERARLQEEAQAAREALEREALRQAEEAARQQAALERQRALELEAKQQEESEREQAVALERQRALELEAKRQEEAKQQQEIARQQAAALERQRALELEAKQREDAQRQEQARAAKLALELEALRRAEEAARQAAALARQQELEAQTRAAEIAARERAAALAATERGRSSGGAIGPATISGKDLAARALSQLRIPGALRAEPQAPRSSSPVAPQPPSSASTENPRRRTASGGAERDIGLRMYIESWRWKVERNGNLNYPSGARTRAAENPVVSVALRRDGSVEDVRIHRSSGQRDLDEAVRRIVQLNAPYSVFPPDLARAYDVIEIRRVWVFGNTLRIVEELN